MWPRIERSSINSRWALSHKGERLTGRQRVSPSAWMSCVRVRKTTYAVLAVRPSVRNFAGWQLPSRSGQGKSFLSLEATRL